MKLAGMYVTWQYGEKTIQHNEKEIKHKTTLCHVLDPKNEYMGASVTP